MESAVNTRKLNPVHLTAVIFAAVVIGLILKRQFSDDMSDWWEFAGFVTGVVSIYLVAVEHIINWPIGIVNVLIYFWVFSIARLYADVTLQILFFLLSVHGWWQWARGGASKTSLSISRIKPSSWLIIGVLWIAGTLLYWPIVGHFKDSAPFLDSTLTVGSMIAQVLLNKKKLENWILWIVIDTAYIPLYISKHLNATAFLYGLFLLLAIVGFFRWIQTYGDPQIRVNEGATAPSIR